jgi:putative acetyltransferase
MQIRRQYPDESEVVAAVVTAAFGEEGAKVAAVWADVVARGLARASLVVDDGGEVVGHVGLSHAWLDARDRLVDVLVLSPLSVRPDRQARGRGTALVAAALVAAVDLGAPAVFLEGDPRYYGRRGFARASGHGFEAPSRRTPDPAFQVALLPEHEPWMTGRLVYRDVWWEHDAAGLRDPLLAEVEAALGA